MVFSNQMRSNRGTYAFTCGEQELEQVHSYKYLGVIIDDDLMFADNAKEKADSGGTETWRLGNLSWKVFDHMLQVRVFPILDYGSEIWLTCPNKELDRVLEQAARFFLGAPQTTALLGLEGETRWLKAHEQSKIALLRLFNRICRMDCGRLPHHILAACKDLEIPFFQYLKQLMADLSFTEEWESLSE